MAAGVDERMGGETRDVRWSGYKQWLRSEYNIIIVVRAGSMRGARAIVALERFPEERQRVNAGPRRHEGVPAVARPFVPVVSWHSEPLIAYVTIVILYCIACLLPCLVSRPDTWRRWLPVYRVYLFHFILSISVVVCLVCGLSDPSSNMCTQRSNKISQWSEARATEDFFFGGGGGGR